MFTIIQAPSPNYRTGTHKKIAIVDHITSGSMPGCLEWLRNPAAKASANYLVTRDGRIYQLVKDEDTAYHAGIVSKPNWSLYDGTNPNKYTIGIEHEGIDGSLTDIQFDATAWLHYKLITKFGIPIDNNHIIGHYRIDSVNRSNCPGPKFPWEKLFEELIIMALLTKDSAGNIIKTGTVPTYKTEMVQEALQKGYITQSHDGNEVLDIGMFLAIFKNALKARGLW